jgi:hypothetical protein
MRRFALAASLGAALALIAHTSFADGLRQEYVRVTFYVLPGRMADEAIVHPGAAACSAWIPMGTQLEFPDGYVVTCEDRGHGDWYWPAWVDVWAPSMAWGRENVEACYGPYAWVTVRRWGWDG